MFSLQLFVMHSILHSIELAQGKFMDIEYDYK